MQHLHMYIEASIIIMLRLYLCVSTLHMNRMLKEKNMMSSTHFYYLLYEILTAWYKKHIPWHFIVISCENVSDMSQKADIYYL